MNCAPAFIGQTFVNPAEDRLSYRNDLGLNTHCELRAVLSQISTATVLEYWSHSLVEYTQNEMYTGISMQRQNEMYSPFNNRDC